MNSTHTTAYRSLSALLIVAILSVSLISPTKAEAGASSGIAGKCATQVLASKGTAWAIGAVLVAISEAIQADQTVIAVPSNDLGTGSGAILQSGEGAASAAMSYLEPLTNCVIHEASQMAIDTLNTQVVGWIKTGINGNPNYATGLNKLFIDLSTMVTGELKSQIQGLTLCDFNGSDTFKNNLGNNVALSTRQNSRAKFAAKVECPFQGTGAADFYSNFSQGGWSGFATALSDSGNAFGLAVQTGDELAAREQETQDVQDKQLAQSDGFMPVVDPTNCTYPDGLEAYLAAEGDDTAIANAQRLYCQITTPGKTVSDELSQVVGGDLSRLMTSNSVNTILDGFITEQVNNAATGIFQ